MPVARLAHLNNLERYDGYNVGQGLVRSLWNYKTPFILGRKDERKSNTDRKYLDGSGNRNNLTDVQAMACNAGHHLSNLERVRTMTYIQRRGLYLETVDQFETRKEALYCLKEYRIADPYASYYLSSRPCKDWLSN